VIGAAGAPKAGVSVSKTPEIPIMWRLSQNRPNPFSHSTTIHFQVGGIPRTRGSKQLSLKVYNPAGQLIRTLLDEPKSPGLYTIQWDGRDESGRRVGSGVYFCRLQGDEFAKTCRMVLLR
jgi:hypothetical protein